MFEFSHQCISSILFRIAVYCVVFVVEFGAECDIEAMAPLKPSWLQKAIEK
jgi:hypothetical protein